MKLGTIIKKNFRLLIRSRSSALVVLFGPLLIMLIVGIAFNSQASLNINVGYKLLDKNNLSLGFVKLLDENYNTREYNKIESCISDIKSSDMHICILFPADFRISNNKTNKIIFLVDNSKINLFESVIDSIEKRFNNLALEVSESLTKGIVMKLNEAQETLENKSRLIERLKKEGLAELKKVKEIKEELKEINASYKSSKNVNYLKTKLKSIKKSLEDIESYYSEISEKTNELIDSLNEKANSSSMSSSEKSDFSDELNDTKDELNSIEDDLNTTINTSISLADEGLELNSKLKTEITGLRQKLDNANRKLEIAIPEQESLEKSIEKSYSYICAVEKALKGIFENINSTKVTDVNTITRPIEKDIKPVVTEQSQLSFYFPYLVIVVIMFIGLMLSSTLVIMEKSSKAFFRNTISPVREHMFIIASFFTVIIVLILQAMIIFSLFSFYFGKDITGNFPAIGLALFAAMFLFSILGIIIGSLFQTEETGTIASISLTAVFIFMSDLVLPLEKLPANIAVIAKSYNPFMLCSDILRRAIVHKAGIEELGTMLQTIGIYIFVLITSLLLIYYLKRISFSKAIFKRKKHKKI